MKFRQSGITLVEVVIATLVLSMIVLALVSAMRTFSVSYSFSEKQSTRTSSLREVSSFLRHSMREAIFRDQTAFSVGLSEITWMAPLDRLGSAGGIVFLKLQKIDDQLILDFAKPSRPDEDREFEPVWGSFTSPQILLNGVDEFSIEVRPHPLEDWRQGYGEELGGLPHSIRLNIDLVDVEWPPLVVSLEGYLGRS